MPLLGHAVKSRLPWLLRRVFETGQRFGANILPNHFYSDIPDFRHLRATTYWRKPYSMHNVNGSETEAQLEFARRITGPYTDLLRDHGVYNEACRENGERGYGPIEGAFLYCYIRAEKPQRITQIGCGVSTSLILRAARDEGYSPQVTCVEPYPTAMLRKKAEAGDITLIPKMMQDVPRDELAELGERGLLFIDSSHSLRVGSEVVQIICEVLPRLQAGTRVHFHDIPFPYDYTPGLFGNQVFFFREPALLYAYLVDNPRFSIEASLAMLHYEQEKQMCELLPAYRPVPTSDGLATGEGHFPSSIFLRVTSS